MATENTSSLQGNITDVFTSACGTGKMKNALLLQKGLQIVLPYTWHYKSVW